MKRKLAAPREYPDWLDDYGSRIHDATIGEYPDACDLEWHATIYDYQTWRGSPASAFGLGAHPELIYGVNISSEHWGLGCVKRTFEEAMDVINDFQIEHNIPSSNYKLHIQYRPEKVKKDAMQMKLFSTLELKEGCLLR